MESLTLRSVLAEIAAHAGDTVTAIDAVETPPGLALRLAPSGARLRLHLQSTPPLIWLDPGPGDPREQGGGRRTPGLEMTAAPPGLAGLLRQLRERAAGARLARAEQIGLGRVALIHFERRDRIGDARPLTLVLEIMGSFGNLILIDGPPQTGRIVERLQPDRRRDAPRALERGGTWRAPARAKSDLILDGAAAVVAALGAPPRPLDAAGWAQRVTDAAEGIGPRLARDLVAEALLRLPADAGAAPPGLEAAIVTALWRRATLAAERREAGILTLPGGRQLVIVGGSFGAAGFEPAASASEAVRRVAETGGTEPTGPGDIDPGRSALGRSIEQRRAEALRRVEQLRRELGRRPDGVGDRLRGEALLAYAHEVPRGAAIIKLPLGAEGQPTEIPLDPRRSAADNAARFFQEARKAERAAEQLPVRLKAAEALLGRCDEFATRFASLPLGDRPAREALESAWTGTPTGARTDRGPAGDAAAWRATGPAAPGARRGPQAPSAALQPKRYEMPGGWVILVGRSQAGNDYLTHALAAPHDLWFHAHGAAGSHVVLKGPDQKSEPDKSLILAAAALAALNSKARHASKVPVTYAEKRHVRKPRGGKPGLAVVTHEKSVMVRPAEPAERRES